MKKFNVKKRAFKRVMPMLLLILLELCMGILLLVYGKPFVEYLVIGFGIAVIIFGITQLIQYLKGRQDNTSNAFILTSGVVTILFGLSCTIFAGKIIELLAAAYLGIFGIMLIVSGIYKIGIYFDLKKVGMPITIVPVISGVVALVSGAVILFFSSTNTLLRFIGIIHILVAVTDIFALMLKSKKISQPGDSKSNSKDGNKTKPAEKTDNNND